MTHSSSDYLSDSYRCSHAILLSLGCYLEPEQTLDGRQLQRGNHRKDTPRTLALSRVKALSEIFAALT